MSGIKIFARNQHVPAVTASYLCFFCSGSNVREWDQNFCSLSTSASGDGRQELRKDCDGRASSGGKGRADGSSRAPGMPRDSRHGR